MSIQDQGKRVVSPNQKILKRLLKNRPAVFGLFVIAFAIFIAIFGYLITPDQSPNANDQIIEIALKDPGFEVLLLKKRKNRKIESKNIFQKLLFGQENAYKLVPIQHHQFRHDSIEVNLYSGDELAGNKGDSKIFPLADIVFAIDVDSNISNTSITTNFQDIDGKNHAYEVGQLQEIVKKDHLEKKKFILGTDKYGRCMFSRLLLGVRISLLVGLISVFLALTIGILLGVLAGYFGGKIDDLIMLLINTAWSIPTLLLVFAIVLALGKGIGIIFLAVGLTMWVDVARIVRGQVLAIKSVQYVEAAQSMGYGLFRILRKHILPNIMGPVFVIAAANFAMAILLEAGLSYLGFGIQPPKPSWGTMLNEHYALAIGGKPLLALVPAIAIMLMVLAFNLVGNGLRDALDVKSDD